MFCFAPVIFSGARFGPQFDYSCIKGGTKFGSHFWLPFSVFSRSTFIKKANAKRIFTTRLSPYAIVPVDFMYARPTSLRLATASTRLSGSMWLKHLYRIMWEDVTVGKTTPYKNSEIKWLRKHLCIHILSDTNGWVDSKIFKSTWTCYGTHSHLNIYPELCL